MGLWTDRLLPRCTDVVLRTRPIGALRSEALAGLEGTVVEIGFGSGLNLPHYPPAVRELLAVEPSTVARRLAEPRLAASTVRVEFAALDGEHLPFEDASLGAAVSTFTLCTIPDAAAALRELRRVLRPGGRLHLLEHGLSPDPGVARWQNRLDPLEQRVAGGCHLTRPIDALVEAAGFSFERVRHLQLPGPRLSRPWGYLTLGVATR